MTYERQYDIGDYITAAGLSGVVEEVGLRTTRLHDWSGDVHTIPNGLVDKTTNKSRAGSRALVEVAIAPAEDVRKAVAAIQVWARTRSLEQFAVERELRLRIKEALQNAGVEMPYQRVMIVPQYGGHAVGSQSSSGSGRTSTR